MVYCAGVGLGVWAVAMGIGFHHDGLVAGGFVATLFFFGCIQLSKDTPSRRSRRIREEDHPHTTLYPSRKRSSAARSTWAEASRRRRWED